VYNPIMNVREVNDEMVVLDIEGKLEVLSIPSLFNINEANLTAEMASHSARFARVATLCAMAERYQSFCKQLMEIEYSEADYKIREEHKESGTKFTEPSIKGEVTTDDLYIEKVKSYDDASFTTSLLKRLLDAMKVKADMLISIGAQLRSEMNMTGMNIREYESDTKLNEMKEDLKTYHKNKVQQV